MKKKTDKIYHIRCTNCGGEYTSDAAACPYCGTIYVAGAEAHYMNKLDNIREDMEDLNELARKETGAELKSAVKKTILTVVFIVGGVALIMGILYLIYYIKWGIGLFF